MSQVFSAITKGDLKKFNGKKCNIRTRGWTIAADGEILVDASGDVLILTDKDLGRVLNEASATKQSYARAYVIYYGDEEDSFIMNEYVERIEIL